MAADEVKVLADAKKLPLQDRIAHANWKARVAAYEDISAACAGIYEEGDPKLSEYGALFVKSVADSNAAAQDKALDALNAFLAKASDTHVSRCVDKTCQNLVSKALNGRTGTVQRATEALLSFIELEQTSAVVDALIEGLKNKVVKVVLASTDALIIAISQFGSKLIVPQPILKALPDVLDSKDGKIREKAKELVVELSRWTGPDLVRTILFKSMRDAIKETVERGIQEVQKTGRAKPERFTRRENARLAALRAQQEAAGQPEASGQGEAQAEQSQAAAEDEEQAEVDPYEVVEPRDVLKELKKEFWEGLESKKWSDRKAALTQLKELATYPRLASGRDHDYGDVNRELRKVITKDNNVACVAEAIACTAALAQGLRAAYSATAKNFAEVLLEKMKEKNAAVSKAISEALTAMNKHCFSLIDTLEQLTAALGNASPKVKEDTLAWLKGAVAAEAKPMLAKLAPSLLPPAVKCAEEATPALREAAMAFMVAFAVKFGNLSMLDKFTSKMEDGKKKRLDELLAEAKGTTGGQTSGNAGAGIAAPPGPAPSLRVSSRPSAAAAALAASRTSQPATVRSSIAGGAPPSSSKQGGKASVGSGGAAKKGGAALKEPEADDEASLACGTLTRDEALTRMTLMFGEATVNQLQDTQWKARLDAMDLILSQAQDGTLADQSSAVLQALAHLPGWDDKNFQVMAKQFEVIRVVASTAPMLTKRDAFVAITGIVDKVSDIKLKAPASEALMAISEMVGPSFVATLLHKKAAVHKNPKVLSEVHNWIATAMLEFGLAQLNVKALLDWAKEDLQSANAGVRNSVMHMLVTMHRFLGPPVGDMIRADVKPALMAALEADFTKNPKDTSLVPTRVCKGDVGKKAAASKSGAGGGTGGAASNVEQDAGLDADELLPRTDISGSLSGTLITNLGSSNWKERKDGMDEVEALITQAGGRIQPQLGDLVSALKPRLSDSNKNLVAQALLLLGKLAKAMGRPIDKAARVLLGPALKNLSDNKANVRAAVCEMLSAWVSVSSLESIMSELVDALLSPKSTADGRAEGIGWLASLAVSGKVSEHLPDCMRLVALGSADKAAEVRDATGKLVTGLLQVHTAAQLGQASGSLDGGTRKVALDAVSKVSGTAVGATPAASSRPAPSVPAPRPSSAPGVRSSSAGGAVRSSLTKLPAGGVRSSLTLNRNTSASSFKAEVADDGPVILMDNKKEDRARKGKFRSNRLEIRPDELATLEGELGPLVSTQLKGLLFSKDFKRHCEAADTVREALPSMYDEVLGVLDLLLRWCTVRISEANTQVLVKVLDLLKDIMAALEAQGHKLSDFEAKLILPVLAEKAGHNQDKIKGDHKELLRRASVVHPPTKVAAFIKDGLESKNNKTRVVCAEELGSLIDRHGPIIYNAAPVTSAKSSSPPEGVLAALARLVAERDNALRSAALSSLEVAYAFEGDGLWRHLGSKLSESARGLVEERLKYADKELARRGLRPGYRAEEGAGVEVNASLGRLPSRPGTPAGSATSPSQLRPPSPSAAAQRPASPGAGKRLPGSKPGPALATSSILAGLQPPSTTPTTGADKRLLAEDAAYSAGFAAGQGSRMAAEAPAPVVPLTRSVPAPVAASRGVSQEPAAMQGISKASEAELRRDMRRCLQQLQSPDLDEVVTVMKLLCYELMEMNKTPTGSMVLAAFRDNATAIVHIMNNKMELVFTQAGQAISRHEPLNSRACKYALNLLMNIFSTPRLAQAVDEPSLRGLLSVLLLCLVDARLGMDQEGLAMLKALNLLMMKILENCSRTHVFSVLIHLLLVMHPAALELGPKDKMEFDWCDLVVKCLIKMTKMLSLTIQEIDLGRLLLAIHSFFDTLGAEEIRRRGAKEDKPLRMVKTVLHEVCKFKGADIYQHTRDIPGADLEPSLKPIIFPYIDLNLQTLNTARPAAAPAAPDTTAAPTTLPGQALPPTAAAGPPNPHTPRQTESAGGAPSHGAVVPHGNPPTGMAAMPVGDGGALAPSSDLYCTLADSEGSARNTLGAIFKRIAENPHDRHQALVDLHFFASTNPDPDVDAMLASASSVFRQFILRGLHKVRLALAAQASAAQQGALPLPPPQGSPDGEVAVTAMHSTSAGGAVQGAGAPRTMASGAAAAHLKLAGLSAGGAPLSPASPGTNKNTTRNAPVLGEDKIAELRDRMTKMSQAVSNMPTRNSSLSLGQAMSGQAPVLSEHDSALMQGTSLAVQDGALAAAAGLSAAGDGANPGDNGSSLAGIHERLRRLREGEL